VKSKRGLLFFLMFVVAVLVFMASDAYAENIARRLAGGFVRISDNRDGCWFCPLFEKLFCAGNNMAVSLYRYLAVSCAKLAATMMALWLAWLVAKLAFGFSSGGPEFFREFSMSLLRLLVVGTILFSSSSFIFGYYNVLIKTAADFSAFIMHVGVGGSASSGAINPAQKYVDGFRGYPIGYTALRDLNTQEVERCTSSMSGGFSYTAVVSVMQMMQAIHLQLIKFMILGKYLIDYSFEKPFFSMFGLVIPKAAFLTPGLILLISAVWILVATVFKMIDAVVKLLFVCSLTPLFAMFWVFPVTRRYTSTAVKTFITVLFMFVITAILLTMSLKLLSNIGYVQGSKQLPPVEHSLAGLYEGSSYWVTHYFKLSGSAYFILICASIIAVKLIELSPKLAGTLGGADVAGGPGAKLQATVGKAASGAVKLATKATKTGGKMAGNAVKSAGKEAKFWAKQAGKAMKKG